MPAIFTSPFISGGQTYYEYISSLSPTVYYRLGESSGTTAVDDEGTHNATYVNSPTFGGTGAVGDSNTSINLNGSSHHINAGLPASLSSFWENGNGSTFLCWVRPETVDAGHGAILSRTNHVGQGYGIYLRDESGGFVRLRLFKAGAAGGGGWNTTSLPVELNQWNFIAITFKYLTNGLNDPIFYVNGSSVALTQTETGGGSDIDNTHTMYIGRFNDNTGHLDGDLDEVTFFAGTMLTSDQISTAYSLV